MHDQGTQCNSHNVVNMKRFTLGKEKDCTTTGKYSEKVYDERNTAPISINDL